ncbi:MAG TPA: glycoside hydrolase family 27 protein [Terriglobales bacterium]|jgi:alpha-galactosidase|nr:glycoside hydrolase family 27 protein [Terriglobales bacterium]
MRQLWICCVILFVLACAAVGESGGLAPTPPMGWNSWDGYGTTINEADFKANADWLAKHLKAYGWEYVVVDADWFVTNPVAEGNSKSFQYVMDEYGRYVPPVARFPSAAGGVGFKPLADYVHSLGLKFGIHILRGIPREAVARKLPIEGSSFHAGEAADVGDACPWNYDNYGVEAKKAAGQAYYDSIARLYAGWGVDLIKVDCIASHPYKGDEIRMLREALDKSGRAMVLSLSPGPAPLEKAEEMEKYAEMWRISDDVWDLWHSEVAYPQGVGDQFANAAKWTERPGRGLLEPGHWPDADMLPLGYLGPAPGWGKARWTRLTHDEQRTLFTLWSMFRSPLMIGGDLKLADEWTAGLLTNHEVIEVDQHATDSRAVMSGSKTVVWRSKAASGGYYLAVFNISDQAEKVRYRWKKVGLSSKRYKVRDLWERRDLGSARALVATVASHGCVLYRVTQ